MVDFAALETSFEKAYVFSALQVRQVMGGSNTKPAWPTFLGFAGRTNTSR